MRGSDHISWFADIGLGHRGSVGGKGGSLGELQRADIAVPAGFVVTTGAFERCLEALEQDAPLRSAIDALAPDDLTRIAQPPRRCVAGSSRRGCRRACWTQFHPLMHGFAPIAPRPSRYAPPRPPRMRSMRVSQACRTPICGSKVRPRPRAWCALLGQSVFGRVDQLSAPAWHSGARRRDGGRGADHGGCQFRRCHVHAQPHDRRSLGDHDRGRLGPGLGGGRRRGHAGSLGHRQDHRRDLGARHLGQEHPTRAARHRRHRHAAGAG